MATETKRQRHQKLVAQLQTERSPFEPHWRELANYILPRRIRLTPTDTNRGDKRNQSIVDSTATQAANTLISGLMSGMTSSARPWFRFGTLDSDMAKFGPVRDWLESARSIVASALLKSNFYNAAPVLYGDAGVFATGALGMFEDDQDLFRFTPFPLGEYYLANDHKLRVRVFVRRFRMTVRQLVLAFGKIRRNGQPDWSVFSTTVRTAWEHGNYEQWVDVCHVIEPNTEYTPDRLAAKYKPFTDCYYEDGNQEGHDRFLREAGFDEFPISAFRWKLSAGDVYGTDSPGMTALGDVKQLQQAEKMSLSAVDKMVRPPMVAPTGARGTRLSQLPGDMSYYDENGAQATIRPLVDTSRFRVDLLEAKNDQVRSRINQSFFVDLFRLLSSFDATDLKNIAATAINEIKEEKLLMLGPVFGQADQDFLKPTIDRAFAICYRAGMLPEAPPELQGHVLEVEYISAMAQALKAIGRSGVDAFTGYVVNLAQTDPSALDKLDVDASIEHYADMTGVPPDMVHSDEETAAIRQQRAAAAKQQQDMEALSMSASAAKDLSGATLDGNNALTALAGAA